MFKRKIVNTYNDRAWTKRRGGKLDVQDVHGVFSQLSAECKGNSNQGRVWTSSARRGIGQALSITTKGLVRRDVKRVSVYVIDSCEAFNEIRGVAFVAAKLSPNGMGVDCD